MKYVEYKLIHGKKTVEHGLVQYERLELPLAATTGNGSYVEATRVEDAHADGLIANWKGLKNPKP